MDSNVILQWHFICIYLYYILNVVVAGVIVGIVGAVLSFWLGIVHGLGISALLSISVFYLGIEIAGALVGGGFALTK